MLKKLKTFARSEHLNYLVFFLIILNGVVLGLETSQVIVTHTGDLFNELELILLFFFVVEILFKLVVSPREFIRNGWDISDFVIVALSLDPHFRSLSILRMFRVLNKLPHMKQILRSIRQISLQILIITLIMGVLFYTFGVIGVRLYGGATPARFGELDWSLLSLAQIMVGDDYGDIIRDVVTHHVSGWLYFAIITVAFYFVVANLFIGVIVDAIQVAVTRDERISKMRTSDMLAENLQRLERIEQKLTGDPKNEK